MVKLKHSEKFHVARLALTAILVVAVLIARSESQVRPGLAYSQKQVLAYATGMNRSDLLTATNSTRASNGLVALQSNVVLSNSAQAKAEDMITNDYWSHTSPTGIEPWYFFQQAGYVYVSAGENLAFGFNTGFEVNEAWVNSPTHLANILGDYRDVGFGIASGPDYQGGENTVVVAHYGKTANQASEVAPATPLASQPAPTAPPVTTTPQTTPSTTPNTPNTQNGTATAKQQPSVATSTEKSTAPRQQADDKPVSVSALESVKNGRLPTGIAIGLVVVGASLAGYAFVHRRLFRIQISRGQKIALRHPLLDMLVIGSILGLILSTTVGKLI